MFRSARNDGWFWSHPMPLLADIEFDGDGSTILEIKDRALDARLPTRDQDDELRDYLAAPRDMEFPAFGAGDKLIGRPIGALWQAETDREVYEDDRENLDESNLGGSAALPANRQIVTEGLGYSRGWNRFPYRIDRGTNWRRQSDRLRAGRERICSAPCDPGNP